MNNFQKPATDAGKNLRDSAIIVIAPAIIAFLNEFQQIDFGEYSALVGALVGVLLVIVNRYTRKD